MTRINQKTKKVPKKSDFVGLNAIGSFRKMRDFPGGTTKGRQDTVAGLSLSLLVALFAERII